MTRIRDRTEQTNHYHTLGISYNAAPDEVKSAYRGLVKEYHPDCNHHLDNHDAIASINLAYEVLSNPQSRAYYDRSLGIKHHSRPTQGKSGRTSKHKQENHLNEDQKLDRWIKQVYEPISEMLSVILDSLDDQIDDLAADPYDDELMENFQAYLDECRGSFTKAQIFFRTMPNPAAAAGVASYLYHCLNAIADGIEELNYFTMNFDDHHLHTGQELWRRAEEMRYYAHSGMASLQSI
ncbi:MAG: DnaJ domain-containing protein [Pseudanabaenaceae cyanobacterium bins.39]|nr:DnaJ domain-containing protein [Pseudanabaenaceae cyanobacterium bins.39]